jgi:hypothetical protein
MLRKMMIALSTVAVAGAMAASSTADAWNGGRFVGGFGGGFRGGMTGFRGGFVGSNGFAFHNRGFFGPRFGFRNRFLFAPGFAFATAPFGIGLGLYGASCWRWRPLPWGGWQRVWVCGYDYDYDY